jgi:DNA polymerase
MVVGQDWGDVAYFETHRGWEKAGNPTNNTLVRLLGSIGLEVPAPGPVPPAVPTVFFTNAVLCLKTGGLQGSVRSRWFSNCRPYLRRQIEIVRPSIVVGLGRLAFDSILAAFGLSPPVFRAAVGDRAGTPLPGGSRVFAVYHCGSRVRNTHRPLDAQLEDWRRIGEALRALQKRRITTSCS